MDGIGHLPIYRQIAAVTRLARRAYSSYIPQILGLTGLSFVSGILEGIGINAVIPLLTFVLGLQDPATDFLSRFIQTIFSWAHVPFVPKYLLAFIVILFVSKAAVSLWLNYIQIGITTEYERRTRSRLFSFTLRSSWPYLLREKLGNLETALTIDTPAATSVLTKLAFMITIVAGLIMYLVVAFAISPLITCATILLGVLVFAALRPLMSRVHATSTQRAEGYRAVVEHIGEHVSGLKSVKAYSVSEAAIESGDTLFGSIKTLSARLQLYQQIATQAIAPIGVVYIGAVLSLAFKTSFISVAALPAILYLIYRIFTYVQQLQNTVQNALEQMPHLERVLALEAAAGGSPETARGDRPFILQKELAFEDVSFSYDNGPEVLKRVSFKVPRGSMVGIVGPSGAGKTTCVDLMLRLLEPTNGAIRADGVDGRTISLDEWRKHVAYVSQDPFILHGTIRENIAFYDPTLTDEDILHAAQSAHIDDFIATSSRGLDTLVGGPGVRLSAGERQRIVIARALARKPELLILDEATSALDNESEAHIKRVVDELKGTMTIIAIAHRLSTVMDSDQLVVLSDGGVVEQGSPKKLLADPESYFYKVYTINQ